MAKVSAKAKKSKEASSAGVDAWLRARPEDQGRVLEALRQQIKAAAPELIETIAYGVPAYYIGTTHLLGFAAFTKHVTLGIGHQTLDTMREELAGYDALKDTIKFTPDRPLPAALVKKLVKTRVALHDD